MALKHPFTACLVTSLFLSNVAKLHGMLKNLGLDKDFTFTSSFQRELFKLLGVNLSYSYTYHSQSDDQIKAVKNA